MKRLCVRYMHTGLSSEEEKSLGDRKAPKNTPKAPKR